VAIAWKTMLSALGYQVTVADNGVHALELYDRDDEPIDVLMTDLVMPKLGGLDLVRKLRKRDNRIKVLVVSGYPLESNWEEVGREEGIDGSLSKPVTIEVLARAQTNTWRSYTGRSKRLVHSRLSALREVFERFAGETPDRPSVLRFGTRPLIRLHREFVPVEHRPFHSATATFDGDACQRGEQSAAVSSTSGRRPNIEILEIETSPPQERRVVVKKQRKAYDVVIDASDKRLCLRWHPEQRPPDVGFGGDHLVGHFLVVRQLLDKSKNNTHVVFCGGTNTDRTGHSTSVVSPSCLASGSGPRHPAGKARRESVFGMRGRGTTRPDGMPRPDTLKARRRRYESPALDRAC